MASVLMKTVIINTVIPFGVVRKMMPLWIAALVMLVISFFLDTDKTFMALKRSWKTFSRMLSMFIIVLVLVSLSLSFIPPETITRVLSGKGIWFGSLIAASVGSITAMPGFVAFPLAGILAEQGIPYTVLAAFTTTLMMVGFVTFPMEQAFLGTKVAFARNISSLLIALLVSIAVGVAFGEFF